MRFVVRVNSVVPNRSSSRRRCRLSAGCVTWSREPAWVSDPSAATAATRRRSLNSSCTITECYVGNDDQALALYIVLPHVGRNRLADCHLTTVFMRHPFRRLARDAGLHFLARRRAACGVAILTMTLALSANTTAFSVVHTFLRASLAIPDPDRVVLIAPVRNLPGRGTVVFAEAFPNYETIRRA